ncbi:UDP-N-acetylmuramoyl-L-alanine--D-glutamate ligase [Alteromonas oceanisediminis]|uniref:UDP-N-acetylmuramoyl-L-alanine--D-glutamate ligase n=1 Tax=Alteromonas oceanisediminis TaxID=2836180 RepID=UPI001BDA78A7|nr:UDP-N-acetylmuramoyl-L-alanine--D-glutamate ligase [Alteromonas oceanisediminis]MBT0585523.1 UDP-N-acetylmuramoyl-L-alanine--D-glutamate ligase [Alteromonas oceanisediminis]
MHSVAALQDKKVAIIGAGMTGISCVRFLTQHNVNVSVFDTRSAFDVDIQTEVQWGPLPPEALLNFDIVVVSPGVSLTLPALVNAMERGIDVIGDIELFARFNQVPTIGVTGSNGKSTVVSLLGAILSAAGKHPCVSGNIGTPVLDTLLCSASDTHPSAKDYDFYVLELSSFQLESTTSLALDVAAVLNVSEDHLDRHHNMANYTAAKQRIWNGAKRIVSNRQDNHTIASGASPDDTFGLDYSSRGMAWRETDQTILYHGQPFIDFAKCKLEGLHNVLNIQAAALLALAVGIDANVIENAVCAFDGLSHRYQTVVQQAGVRWINDSKATNPGAARVSIMGARAQTQGKLIVVMGGDGKGADLSALKPLLEDAVDYLITLGVDGKVIMALVDNSVYVDNMQQAVNVAKRVACSGDTVLLSPACASIDMFRNYAHRGDSFAAAVAEVAA